MRGRLLGTVTTAATALGAVVALTLTGCSGSGSASPGETGGTRTDASSLSQSALSSSAQSPAPTGSAADGAPGAPGAGNPTETAHGATTTAPAVSPTPVGTAVPADVPTTGPNLRHADERPPVMPLLATRHTPSGAVAFAKFFIRTIDWGFATTSGAYMRHYFEPSCIECASHADGLDHTRDAGDRYVGGRFTITRASDTSSPHNVDRKSIVVTFTISALEALGSHGDVVNAEVAHIGEQRELWLVWRRDSWRVTDMGPPQ